MAGLAVQSRNVYEDFEVEKDILFFKLGSHGQVSFHGQNYNIKKRMSADELQALTRHASFVQIKSDCYVNTSKVSSIEDDQLYFGAKDAKSLPVSRRQQQLVRNHQSR
ncbi:LytTR family transcriptional regulator DNA-binding domain-containing protein [Paenibacillus daejeonensis]|uniref:LytTR family transcriptional regulator DNA-binding domain-containing protein n=1 Tax=Paenibacillus daejeonensis TaxID=135193 RepID=UPI00036449F8|nr:LytTR family transcriptional regulator DNA-binding domain-containing protein [Paenibacillus daejeonensis]